MPSLKRHSINRGSLAIALMLMLAAASVRAFDLPITFILPEDVNRHYHDYMQGKDIAEPLTFQSYITRDALEVVLLSKILHQAGYRDRINTVIIDDYKRIISQVGKADASATISATTVWLDDAEMLAGALNISTALIQKGEFYAGIYTAPNNSQALAVTTLAQLQQLKGVSNKTWVIDWRTLKSLNLHFLYHNQSHSRMIKMVHSGRADFMLAQFRPSQDFVYHKFGVELVPIPKVKVYLDGSRHWISSKNGEQDSALAQTINNGIKTLRENGTLNRAFTEAGVFNPLTQDWLVLNPQ